MMPQAPADFNRNQATAPARARALPSVRFRPAEFSPIVLTFLSVNDKIRASFLGKTVFSRGGLPQATAGR
jgi:hypothetical protein